MPLLHVGPNDLVRNGIEAVGESECHSATTAADAAIANDVGLRSRLQQRRGLPFHTFRVCFVAVGVFEEDAISTANGCFAISKHIPGESNSRGRIEQMSLRA